MMGKKDRACRSGVECFSSMVLYLGSVFSTTTCKKGPKKEDTNGRIMDQLNVLCVLLMTCAFNLVMRTTLD